MIYLVAACWFAAILVPAIVESAVAADQPDPFGPPPPGARIRAVPGANPFARREIKWAIKEPNPEHIEALLDEMSKHGRHFQPGPLLEYGNPGLQAALDRMIPKTIAPGDAAALRQTNEAAGNMTWGGYGAALGRYFDDLPDPSCHREIALRAVRGLKARLDKTSQRRALYECFRALAKSRDDNVHHLLLPLLEHEDPAVPFFAMKAISGRTGNSYIAPIHMGAIASGRRELIKQGLSSMPCPIWDRRNWPIVREVYVKIFEQEDKAFDFRDDPQFMRLCAFVAARDFRIIKARDYLLNMIRGSEPDGALRAIGDLGDTYYIRDPIYPELLEALTPHLESDRSRFRDAAVATLSCYKGDGVAELLIPRLQDDDETVREKAAKGLVAQHGYYRDEPSNVPMLVRAAAARETTKIARDRINAVLISLGEPIWEERVITARTDRVHDAPARGCRWRPLRRIRHGR
jgi:hypothetical protein